MFKQIIYRHKHPIANSRGKIRKSRYILYEKLKGIAGKCYWCKIKLSWNTLCADHLDSNIMNDTSSNLVGSCRGCNANRNDGTGYGRKKPKKCPICLKQFIKLDHHNQQIYCNINCSILGRTKRGTKAKHGSRSRYMYGCRCKLCIKSNSNYWKKWNKP